MRKQHGFTDEEVLGGRCKGACNKTSDGKGSGSFFNLYQRELFKADVNQS